MTQQAQPHYVVEELATANSVASWLNTMTEQNYRLVSLIPMEQTNHFNQEVSSVLWVVMELKAPEA